MIVFMWGLGLYNYTANCVFCDEFILLEFVEIVYVNSVSTVIIIHVSIIILIEFGFWENMQFWVKMVKDTQCWKLRKIVGCWKEKETTAPLVWEDSEMTVPTV